MSQPPRHESPTTLSETTRIRLTIPQIFFIVCTFLSLYGILEKNQNETNSRIMAVDQKVTSMQYQMRDTVSEADLRNYTDQLRTANAGNPNITVPYFRRHTSSND